LKQNFVGRRISEMQCFLILSWFVAPQPYRTLTTLFVTNGSLSNLWYRCVRGRDSDL